MAAIPLRALAVRGEIRSLWSRFYNILKLRSRPSERAVLSNLRRSLLVVRVKAVQCQVGKQLEQAKIFAAGPCFRENRALYV